MAPAFLGRESHQTVILGPYSSRKTILDKGVPQGSYLSPTLFNIYMDPLARIAVLFGFEIISYADDTQLMFTFDQNLLAAKKRFIHSEMLAISEWMNRNYLQLNTDKTEIMLLGKAASIWTNDWWPHQLGVTPVPEQAVKNLGMKFDQALTMKEHILVAAGVCYYNMRLLRRIFPYLPTSARKTLVQAWVISRLDYGNALFADVNKTLMAKLQVVQNTAARLVLNRPSGKSSAPLLRELHRLPVKKR